MENRRMKKLHRILSLAALAVLFSLSVSSARDIIGTSVLRLTTPATPEIVAKSKALAYRSFRIDCMEWMKEDLGVTIDTLNAIWKYHLFSFSDSCIHAAKEEVGFVDHDWTVTYTLSPEKATDILKAYNTRCQIIALRTWTQMKKLLDDNVTDDVFQLGVQSIFYTMGRMEQTVEVPGEESAGAFLVADVRKILQAFLDKISIRTQNFVIKGKPGTFVKDPVVFQLFYNETPVPNFDVIGKLGVKKILFSGKTASDGTIVLESFKMPFVSKGAFLYVGADFSAAINNLCPLSAGDLGIKFPEQTLLFNVIPATFILKYRATAASAVKIPQSFSSDVYLMKFLCDSCHIKPIEGNATPDLIINLTTQVSSYNNETTEQTTLKVENALSILDAQGNIIIERSAPIHGKAYENAIDIPYGVFFWESARKSCAMVKAVLGEM
jgi:hypothetical protein